MTRLGTSERTCIGCRATRPSSELTRFAIDRGTLVEGLGVSGRGAWLCSDDIGCLDRATRSGAFSRALRTGVSSDSIEATVRRWTERAASRDATDVSAANSPYAGGSSWQRM